METGYVKFFDTREGKLFGFVEDEMGNELFFHFSDGMHVGLHELSDGYKSVRLIQMPTRLRYPKKSDQLMFVRGKNPKGPKAARWCFKSDYDDMLDKSKRNLTLDEAKELLGNSKAKVLEYIRTTESWGTTKILITTKITWYGNGDKHVATGEFKLSKERRGKDSPDRVMAESAVVDLFSTDRTKYHDTQFQLSEANALKELGNDRQVDSGVYESVMWNGGSDHYVVDPRLVRTMMTSERNQAEKSPAFPEIGGWLRCRFAPKYGNKDQMVKILAHLGGHE